MGDEEVDQDCMKVPVTITFDPRYMTADEAAEYAQSCVDVLVASLVSQQVSS